jgi:hypothetical protein
MSASKVGLFPELQTWKRRNAELYAVADPPSLPCNSSKGTASFE